jgi:hypothetical protein
MPARSRTVLAPDNASDAKLVARVVKRDEVALRELSHRHAAALSVLACAIVRQPAWARCAVTEVFAAVWATPDRLGATDVSVRAQLAALVHEHCLAMELHPSPSGIDHRHTKEATRRAHDATPERIAVALIAFGDHTCPQAANRAGTDAGIVAERLRAFVLDPDHFQTFCTDDNVVALHTAQRGKHPR